MKTTTQIASAQTPTKKTSGFTWFITASIIIFFIILHYNEKDYSDDSSQHLGRHEWAAVQQEEFDIREASHAQREQAARIAAEIKAEANWKKAAGFSSTGDNYAFSQTFKKQLHDPKSYEFDRSQLWRFPDHIVAVFHYRAKNGFGAMRKYWVKFKVGYDGRFQGFIEQG